MSQRSLVTPRCLLICEFLYSQSTFDPDAIYSDKRFKYLSSVADMFDSDGELVQFLSSWDGSLPTDTINYLEPVIACNYGHSGSYYNPDMDGYNYLILIKEKYWDHYAQILGKFPGVLDIKKVFSYDTFELTQRYMYKHYSAHCIFIHIVPFDSSRYSYGYKKFFLYDYTKQLDTMVIGGYGDGESDPKTHHELARAHEYNGYCYLAWFPSNMRSFLVEDLGMDPKCDTFCKYLRKKKLFSPLKCQLYKRGKQLHVVPLSYRGPAPYDMMYMGDYSTIELFSQHYGTDFSKYTIGSYKPGFCYLDSFDLSYQDHVVGDLGCRPHFVKFVNKYRFCPEELRHIGAHDKAFCVTNWNPLTFHCHALSHCNSNVHFTIDELKSMHAHYNSKAVYPLTECYVGLRGKAIDHNRHLLFNHKPIPAYLLKRKEEQRKKYISFIDGFCFLYVIDSKYWAHYSNYYMHGFTQSDWKDIPFEHIKHKSGTVGVTLRVLFDGTHQYHISSPKFCKSSVELSIMSVVTNTIPGYKIPFDAIIGSNSDRNTGFEKFFSADGKYIPQYCNRYQTYHRQEKKFFRCIECHGAHIQIAGNTMDVRDLKNIKTNNSVVTPQMMKIISSNNPPSLKTVVDKYSDLDGNELHFLVNNMDCMDRNATIIKTRDTMPRTLLSLVETETLDSIISEYTDPLLDDGYNRSNKHLLDFNMGRPGYCYTSMYDPALHSSKVKQYLKTPTVGQLIGDTDINLNAEIYFVQYESELGTMIHLENEPFLYNQKPTPVLDILALPRNYLVGIPPFLERIVKSEVVEYIEDNIEGGWRAFMDLVEFVMWFINVLKFMWRYSVHSFFGISGYVIIAYFFSDWFVFINVLTILAALNFRRIEAFRKYDWIAYRDETYSYLWSKTKSYCIYYSDLFFDLIDGHEHQFFALIYGIIPYTLLTCFYFYSFDYTKLRGLTYFFFVIPFSLVFSSYVIFIAVWYSSLVFSFLTTLYMKSLYISFICYISLSFIPYFGVSLYFIFVASLINTGFHLYILVDEENYNCIYLNCFLKYLVHYPFYYSDITRIFFLGLAIKYIYPVYWQGYYLIFELFLDFEYIPLVKQSYFKAIKPFRVTQSLFKFLEKKNLEQQVLNVPTLSVVDKLNRDKENSLLRLLSWYNEDDIPGESYHHHEKSKMTNHVSVGELSGTKLTDSSQESKSANYFYTVVLIMNQLACFGTLRSARTKDNPLIYIVGMWILGPLIQFSLYKLYLNRHRFDIGLNFVRVHLVIVSLALFYYFFWDIMSIFGFIVVYVFCFLMYLAAAPLFNLYMIWHIMATVFYKLWLYDYVFAAFFSACWEHNDFLKITVTHTMPGTFTDIDDYVFKTDPNQLEGNWQFIVSRISDLTTYRGLVEQTFGTTVSDHINEWIKSEKTSKWMVLLMAPFIFIGILVVKITVPFISQIVSIFRIPLYLYQSLIYNQKKSMLKRSTPEKFFEDLEALGPEPWLIVSEDKIRRYLNSLPETLFGAPEIRMNSNLINHVFGLNDYTLHILYYLFRLNRVTIPMIKYERWLRNGLYLASLSFLNEYKYDIKDFFFNLYRLFKSVIIHEFTLLIFGFTNLLCWTYLINLGWFEEWLFNDNFWEQQIRRHFRSRRLPPDYDYMDAYSPNIFIERQKQPYRPYNSHTNKNIPLIIIQDVNMKNYNLNASGYDFNERYKSAPTIDVTLGQLISNGKTMNNQRKYKYVGQASNNEQIMSPPHIAYSFLKSILRYKSLDGLELCEPCAGSGNILQQLRNLVDEGVPNVNYKNITLVDIDPQVLEITPRDNENIFNMSILSLDKRFDAYITNPPFGQDWNNRDVATEIHFKLFDNCSEFVALMNTRKGFNFYANHPKYGKYIEEIGSTQYPLHKQFHYQLEKQKTMEVVYYIYTKPKKIEEVKQTNLPTPLKKDGKLITKYRRLFKKIMSVRELSFDRTKDLYTKIIDLSHILGCPALVDEMLKHLRKNLKTFLERVSGLIDFIEKTMTTKAAYKNSMKALNLVSEILSFFNPTFRYRAKPAWAPILSDYHKLLFKNEIGVNLAEFPVYQHRSFEATLKYYITHLNQHKEFGVAPLALEDFRRSVNSNPYIDTHLNSINHVLRHEFDIETGVDGIQFANAEVVDAATARYYEKSTANALTDLQIDRVARFMNNAWPSSFTNLKLTPFPKIWKHVEKKYSSGMPFYADPRYKKKRDIMKDNWHHSIYRVVQDILESGKYPDQLHHVFPKSQVVTKEKLLQDPAKLRTIIAQNSISYMYTMFFAFDLAKRQQWWARPMKPGMPLTGAAFNVIFAAVAHRKRHMSLDVTAFDSKIPPSIVKIVEKIIANGFEHHPNNSAIARHLTEIFRTVQKGYFVNTMAESVDHSLYVKRKETGGTTGWALTSEFNSIALVALIIEAVCTITSTPIEDFLKDNDIMNFGDDNVFSTDFVESVLSSDDLVKYFASVHKMNLKVEKVGSIFEQEFLSKSIHPSEKFEDEFIEANIPRPTYAVTHNMKTLMMRYGYLKNEKAYRFEKNQNERAMYMVERIQGCVVLTAHQPKAYDFFASEYKYWYPKIKQSLRNKPGFVNKYKFPSYMKVITDFYKPPKIKLGKDIEAAQWLYSGFYNFNHRVENILAVAQSIMCALPAQMFACDDPELEDLSPMFNTNNMDVESFVYLSTVLNRDVIDDISLSTFISKINESPYKPVTNPLEFYQHHRLNLLTQRDEMETKLRYYRKRMHLLALIYFNTNTLVKICRRLPLLNLFANLYNIYNYDLPKVYSWTNFMYWMHYGSSSMKITQYIPKDLYINQKRMAVFLLDHVPKGLENFMVTAPFGEVIAKLAEIITQFLNVHFKSVNEEMSSNFKYNKSAWTPYVLDIIKQCEENNNEIVISAPTSTGKTFFFPQELLGKTINGHKIGQIIICEPRKVLVESLGIPGLKKINKHQTPSIKDRYICGTYGHILATYKENLYNNNTVFIFDEFHEQSPEMVILYEKMQHKFPIFFTSATPKFSIIKTKFHLNKVPLQRKHKLHTIDMTGWNATSALLALYKYDKLAREKDPEAIQYGTKVLIIEPHGPKCESIIQTLKNINITNVSFLNADNRKVMNTDVIVATSIVDAGITIDGVTCVINSGYSVVNHKNVLFNIVQTESTNEQRLGRTARTQDGIGINLVKPKNFDYIQYPTMTQVLEEFEIVSKYYNIKNLLDPLPTDANSLNQYIKLHPDFEQYRHSLHAWLECLMQGGDTLKLYRLLQQRIMNESTDYLLPKFFDKDLVDLKTLSDLLELEPYVYSTGCKIQRSSTFYFSNGIVGSKEAHLNRHNMVPKEYLRENNSNLEKRIDFNDDFMLAYGIQFTDVVGDMEYNILTDLERDITSTEKIINPLMGQFKKLSEYRSYMEQNNSDFKRGPKKFEPIASEPVFKKERKYYEPPHRRNIKRAFGIPVLPITQTPLPQSRKTGLFKNNVCVCCHREHPDLKYGSTSDTCEYCLNTCNTPESPGCSFYKTVETYCTGV